MVALLEDAIKSYLQNMGAYKLLIATESDS